MAAASSFLAASRLRAAAAWSRLVVRGVAGPPRTGPNPCSGRGDLEDDLDSDWEPERELQELERYQGCGCRHSLSGSAVPESLEVALPGLASIGLRASHALLPRNERLASEQPGSGRQGTEGGRAGHTLAGDRLTDSSVTAAVCEDLAPRKGEDQVTWASSLYRGILSASSYDLKAGLFPRGVCQLHLIQWRAKFTAASVKNV